MISSSMLILPYTIQEVLPNICTKFPNPRRSSSWEIFDTNFPLYYFIGVRDEKREKWKKKAKINHSILVLSHNILGTSQGVYEIWRGTVIEAETSVTKCFIREKENGQIKGLKSSSMLILFYTIQQVIPNICTKFQNLGAVVPEKSLTQISQCITLEWEMEKKKHGKWW